MSISTSKTITDNRVHFCPVHPNEHLSLYCLEFGCLKPLCPECVPVHKEIHPDKALRSIQTVKTAKEKCQNKIDTVNLQLDQLLENLNVKHLMSPQLSLKDGMEKIAKTRQQVELAIQQYFQNLEQEFKGKLSNTTLKSSDFEDVFQKVKQCKMELAALSEQIKNPSNIALDAVQKTMLLDTKQLILQFSRDIQQITSNRYFESAELEVNGYNLANFQKALSQVISLRKIEMEPLQMDNFANKDTARSFFGKSNENFNQNKQEDLGTQDEMLKQEQLKQLAGVNKLQINQEDFFQCEEKLLHFFSQTGEGAMLHLTDLSVSSVKKQFDAIKLNIQFPIPNYHQSIITPTGAIYLLGGAEPNQPKQSKIYKYNPAAKSLDLVSNMLTARSSFGICCMNDQIYIIGGNIGKPSGKTNLCEVYSTKSNKCYEIQPLITPVSNCCCTLFNNSYIYKFHGITQEPGQAQKICLTIERYDIELNKWAELEPQLRKDHFSLFKVLHSEGCCQINSQEMLVFGGYDISTRGYKQTYIFRQDMNEKEEEKHTIILKDHSLPQEEGFSSQQVIVQGLSVYALQNVPDQTQSNQQVINQKRLIVNDSLRWRAIF